MDVLVVVGGEEPPERLVLRAHQVVTVPPDETLANLVADLRGRFPRQVGVVGQGGPEVAAQLRRAGLPIELHTDDQLSDSDRTLLEGVEIVALTDDGPPMEVVDSLLDLVGETPLIRLDRTGRDLPGQLLAKLELLNPGGSVKDRPAISMIDEAERQGLIGPGSTIVEGTSGNTGIGLAIVAARRRYRCIFVMPDKMAPEKIALLRAYGAEVVVCPTAVAPDHPDSYYSVTARLASEIPGAYHPNQYANPANPLAHELTTGPEIWRQTKGRITHFVAGIGTGGTITGVGRYLKSMNPDIQIVGADPEGSVYSGGSGRPYLVEGIGEDFWPTTYDPSIVDKVVMVSDTDSFLTARRFSAEEGILVGGSTGTAIHAALSLAPELHRHDVVVVLVPDSGRGYLSRVYSDEWMADHGFLRTTGHTVMDVLERKTGPLTGLIHVHPSELARQAIAVMAEFGVSQLAVIKAEPPLAAAEVVGAVYERDLMQRAVNDPGVLDEPVEQVMAPPLPTVGSGEPMDLAVKRLEESPAVLVLDRGHPVGVLTRSDALAFLAQAGVGRDLAR
jgi:cystathionine beta-synthase